MEDYIPLYLLRDNITPELIGFCLASIAFVAIFYLIRDRIRSRKKW